MTAPKSRTKPSAKTPAQEAGSNVKVMILAHRMRHPVSGVMFAPGVPVDIINLEAPENIFVRHQLAAGVMQLVESPEDPATEADPE